MILRACVTHMQLLSAVFDGHPASNIQSSTEESGGTIPPLNTAEQSKARSATLVASIRESRKLAPKPPSNQYSLAAVTYGESDNREHS